MDLTCNVSVAEEGSGLFGVEESEGRTFEREAEESSFEEILCRSWDTRRDIGRVASRVRPVGISLENQHRSRDRYKAEVHRGTSSASLNAPLY